MSYFLVIHHRRDPARVERVEDPEEAQRRLFELERELRADPDRGVVLLVAEREEDLVHTHSHYFKKSGGELMEPVAS